MARPYTAESESASDPSYADKANELGKDYAGQAADKVAAVAKDAYDDPQRFLRETQEDLTRRTQETPAKTLAIAAGIGFIIGAIWKR